MIAPGTIRMTSVSSTSMVAIETVSDANASGSERRSVSPPRSSGSIVSEYPNTNASETDSTTLPVLLQPHHVDRTMPRISPIAQPVRQWTVSEKAVRVRQGPASRSS